MRISDWSSDVCSSDLVQPFGASANRSWLSCLGNASGLAALPHCGRPDSDRFRGEILMFHRFRPMPATAMAAVLGCALIATAATPAVALEKQQKEDIAQRPKLSPRKASMPPPPQTDEPIK